MKTYLVELYEDNIKVAHSHHWMVSIWFFYIFFGGINALALRKKYTIKVLPAADIQDYP